MSRLWVEEKKSLDDPIPLDECSARLRMCLTLDFGPAPTFRQAFERSPQEWLRAPNFGRRTLKELHFVLHENTDTGWDYDDLPTRVLPKREPRSAHPSWDDYGPRI